MKKKIKGFLVVGSALLCGFVFADVNSSEYENPPPVMMQIGEYEDVEVNLPPGAVILKPAQTTPRRKELPFLQPIQLPERGLRSQLLGTIEEHPWMRRDGFIDTLINHGAAAYIFSDLNAFEAVRFTPERPCSIMAILFAVHDPTLGNYDSLFWIYAWDNGVNSLPGSVIHGPQEYKYTHDGWQCAYLIPPKFVADVFHLGYFTYGSGIWADAGPGNGTSSCRRNIPTGGSWLPGASWQGPTSYNWIIEAIVKYPSDNEIITENYYLTRTEVSLKPVFKGGYETVYSSQEGTQSTPDAHIPLSYVFSIFPNPFARTTGITYALPHQTRTDIAIYDVNGRLVKTVVSANLEPGYYTDTWSGEDDIGRKVAAGVYFITLTTDDYKSYNKVILVR